MIRTEHIGQMLTEARVLAVLCNDAEKANDVVLDRTAEQVLERAANLAEHAAAELRDELLRARDGWPSV
jgi:hypothetical protein